MSRAIPQLVSAALNPNAGLSYLYSLINLNRGRCQECFNRGSLVADYNLQQWLFYFQLLSKGNRPCACAKGRVCPSPLEMAFLLSALAVLGACVTKNDLTL